MTLTVYDALGRRVASLADGAERPAGYHPAALEAGALAPGAYVVRMAAAGRTFTRRVTVIR